MSRKLRFGGEIKTRKENNQAPGRFRESIFRPSSRPKRRSVEHFVVKTGFAHWYAMVFSVGLTFAMESTELFGSSPPYPDEIQNPHIVPPQLELGTYGVKPGELNDPMGVCVSVDGEIYIADTSNNRIQVFSKSGQPLRTWGEAGHAPGQFVAPHAIAVSSKGEVFVADTGNNRVQVFDGAGTPLRQWGSYGEKTGEFKKPCGIAAGVDRVYVVDQGNERLQVFNLEGEPLSEFGGYGDGSGKFNQPSDVTVDNDGNVYVADSYNDRIQKFNRLGRPLSSWGSSGSHNGLLATPSGLCYRDGKIYVADTINHRIQAFDVEGNFLFQWGRHPNLAHEGNGSLHYPTRIAIAPESDFAVVLEPSEYRFQVFGTSNVVRVENVKDFAWWGAPEGFHFGSRLQARGQLVAISEPDTHSVLVFDNSAEASKLITRLGGDGKEPGRFIWPSGTEIDPDSGDIYVCDSGNYRLQRFALQRNPDTGAFFPNTSSFVQAIDLRKLVGADGAPKLGAIGEPSAVKRDAQGNVYMADPKNARIVVLDRKMNLIRSWGEWGNKEGQFRLPSDLAFNKAEDVLYVTDPCNFRVQAFDKTGRFLFAWGSPGLGADQFMYAGSVCVGTDGSVFVSDAAANRIDKFDPHGRPLKQWGTWGTAAGQFYKPNGIVQDEKGRIIVIDLGNDRVQMFTPDGEFIRMFAVGEVHTSAHASLASQLREARKEQSITAAPVESPPAAGKSIISNGGAYEIKYLAAPTAIPLNEPFDLQFSVLDQAGKTLGSGITVQVDAGMPAHHHGMNQKAAIKVNSDGTYTASGLLFHMPGRWQIYFDVTRNGITERSQSDVTLE
jgi:tripartite motif-containing protein 71